jgi:serine/threonine-protein kinase
VVRISEVPSQRVERYELLAELAAGGMATVFLARLGGAGGFQRLYAIKRLHPHLAREREFVEMFLDEARLAARIHHPNVVPILEVGQSQSGYFLVMEYIEGETLARLLGRMASRNQRIPIRVGMKVVLDTLAGLEAAHKLRDDFGEPLNIVHRDVSPQNVMVGVDGTSRITDFGVARAATRLNTTRAGQLKGKLGYMAPEQARGDDIDLRADVFAVGVILWETLAGRRLFKGRADASDAQTLNRLLYEPIQRLREAEPSVPPVLEEVCHRALERDPDKRLPTCGAFADALEAAMQQIGGVASPREVAAFVDSVAGPEIELQREAVRNWVTRSEISVIERSDSQSETMPATPSYHTDPFVLGSPVPKVRDLEQVAIVHTKPSSALILGGAAAIAFALVLGGATVYLLSQSSPPDPDVAASSASDSVETGSVPVAPRPADSAQPSATAAPEPTGSAVDAVKPSPTTRPQSTRRDSSGPALGGAKSDAGKGPGEPSKPPAEPSDDLSTNPYRH